jgi:hypothetical protein
VGSVGVGIKEIASFWYPQIEGRAGSQTWSAKALRFDANGSAYIFANDLDRGFDVYRFDATAPRGTDPGSWVTVPAASSVAKFNPTAKWSGALPVCVIVPAS